MAAKGPARLGGDSLRTKRAATINFRQAITAKYHTGCFITLVGTNGFNTVKSPFWGTGTSTLDGDGCGTCAYQLRHFAVAGRAHNPWVEKRSSRLSGVRRDDGAPDSEATYNEGRNLLGETICLATRGGAPRGFRRDRHYLVLLTR